MEIALGTVQFGLAYGIAGRGAPIPDAEARATLELAMASGVRVLDTAVAYGNAEERLGKLIVGLSFRIISKVPPLTGTTPEFVADSIRRSRERLGDALQAILFHRASDLTGATGNPVWAAAEDVARSIGISLGASCYSPEEVAEIRQRFPIAVAQLPGNALDQRLVDATFDADLAAIELHVRSVFLQGLLLMSSKDVERRLPAAIQHIDRWRRWCAEHGLTPLQAALSVAKGMPNVNYLVLGVDGPAHLEEIMREWHAVSPISAPELACDDKTIIDPRQWTTHD